MKKESRQARWQREREEAEAATEEVKNLFAAKRTAFEDAVRKQEDNLRKLAGRPTVPEETAALHRLGLQRSGLTADGIHAAYRRLAKSAHPDQGGSAAFRQLKRDRDLALTLLTIY